MRSTTATTTPATTPPSTPGASCFCGGLPAVSALAPVLPTPTPPVLVLPAADVAPEEETLGRQEVSFPAWTMNGADVARAVPPGTATATASSTRPRSRPRSLRPQG